MDQFEVREMVNSGWFVVSICLVAVFAAFLVKEMREDGWYAKLRNQAAVALIVYFIGEALARGWGVFLLASIARDEWITSSWQVEQQYPIALLGASISFIAAICCVRVFSPPSWGNKAWLAVVAVAAIFMVTTYIY